MHTEKQTEIKKKTGDREKLKTELLIAAALFAFAVFVNRNFRISGLYMDDLYTWSCFGEQGILEFLFPKASTRNRFVYWFVSWVELALIGNHMEWIVPVNLLVNAGLAYFLYRYSFFLSGSRAVGFVSGILFLSSHFSYYQIGQLLGMMETMGIIFALSQSVCLYRYLHDADGERFFHLAVVVYFLNCFTHERYMVLWPMFFYCLIWKREKDLKKWMETFLVFILVLGIRFFTIGTLSPAGTGGTQVADTFTVRSAWGNFREVFFYLFGINKGPEHLSGIPWKDTLFSFKLAAYFMNVCTLLLFVSVLIACFRILKDRKKAGRVLFDFLFFAGFMTGLALSASVTIRVEMRWIYVVYAFALLAVSVLLGVGKEDAFARVLIPKCFFFAAASLSVVLSLYYRTGYRNMYLFPNQERYNSLADVTFGKYGKEVFGKEIIILGNSYEMSAFTADTFFKTFDPERSGQGTSVRHAERITDFGQVTDNMLILKEDPAHNAFTDVTGLVKELKLSVTKGYYPDGWMDEEAEIRLLTGKSGIIRMECMYPGNLQGGEAVSVRINDGESQSLSLKENICEFQIEAAPCQMAALQFQTNFHVEDAKEQRGEKELAMIVNFTAE